MIELIGILGFLFALLVYVFGVALFYVCVGAAVILPFYLIARWFARRLDR